MLQFSGGKDSLACLYLLEPWWDKLIVAWADSGDEFPETKKQMQEIAGMVPQFVVAKGNQPAEILEFGLPADVLSVWNTPLGRAMGGERIKLQDPLSCCQRNRWEPMMALVRELDVTLVIRGQRNSEGRKGLVRNGAVIAGVEYLLPLEDWSRDQVLDFLKERGVRLPESYKWNDSSLDCQHCTGWLSENPGKLEYIDEFHPELGKEVRSRLHLIKRAVEDHMAPLHRILGE
jgi:3''-phosphoadenosine 5''-phosphosulfate sulfotransferase (PAPS reductase)/FAD synthetase and related enzymes